MNHAKGRRQITLSQSMLNFANLPRVDSAQQIDGIFLPHAGLLWNSAGESDAPGLAALQKMHYNTRERLRKLRGGNAKLRAKILTELVEETRKASAQGNIQGLVIPLPLVPEVVVKNGVAGVRNKWLVTGAHAAVVFGLLELFVDGLLDRLSRCENCTSFYLETQNLHVACSIICKQKLRNKDVAKNVQEWRKRRRKAEKRGSRQNAGGKEA